MISDISYLRSEYQRKIKGFVDKSDLMLAALQTFKLLQLGSEPSLANYTWNNEKKFCIKIKTFIENDNKDIQCKY